MNCVFKELRKIPMAAIGLVDLTACAAGKMIGKLAKRGEKTVQHVKKKICQMEEECCCSENSCNEQECDAATESPHTACPSAHT